MIRFIVSTYTQLDLASLAVIISSSIIIIIDSAQPKDPYCFQPFLMWGFVFPCIICEVGTALSSLMRAWSAPLFYALFVPCQIIVYKKISTLTGVTYGSRFHKQNFNRCMPLRFNKLYSYIKSSRFNINLYKNTTTALTAKHIRLINTFLFKLQLKNQQLGPACGSFFSSRLD